MSLNRNRILSMLVTHGYPYERRADFGRWQTLLRLRYATLGKKDRGVVLRAHAVRRVLEGRK